jgi:hypothetical protein
MKHFFFGKINMTTYTFYVELNSTNAKEIAEKGTEIINYWQGMDFGAPFNSGEDGGWSNCNLSLPANYKQWPVEPSYDYYYSNVGNPKPPYVPNPYYDGARGPINDFDGLKFGASNRIQLSKLLTDANLNPNNVAAVWHEVSYRNRFFGAKCSRQEGPDYTWSNPEYCTNLLNKYYGNKCHYSKDNYIDTGDRKVPYINFQNWGAYLSVFNPVYLIGVGCTTGSNEQHCNGMSYDTPAMFYSDLNNHSEEAPDNANIAKMYFPICGFETWNGHTGSCNVCCQAKFQIEINYYKLRAHTMNPNSSYTAESTEFAAGYFDVFPFTPSSTPKVLLGQNLSTVPEVVDQQGDLGEMNFQNSKTSFAQSDNNQLQEFLEIQNDLELYGIWEIQYTFTSTDFSNDNFPYLLYHFLILQQDLFNMSTEWYRNSNYAQVTLQSIKQLLIDYCNSKKDMNDPLCGAENLNFSFLREPPCTTEPLQCVEGWVNYCNDDTTFFTPLCQYVYNNSYNQDGTLNSQMASILQNRCERYSSQVNDVNLTSDYLSVCGCYLPENNYTDILDANPTFSENVGGFEKRQCWYSPCIYANVKPVVPQMMICNDNEITNCVQRTVINFESGGGSVSDNNVIVNKYANHCGGDPQNATAPVQNSTPTSLTETPSYQETPTMTPSPSEETPTESEMTDDSIKFYFKMTNFVKASLIIVGSILLSCSVTLIIKKMLQKKGKKVQIRLS